MKSKTEGHDAFQQGVGRSDKMITEIVSSATVSCGVNFRPYGSSSQRETRGQVPPNHDARIFGNFTRNAAARIEAGTYDRALLGILGAQVLRQVSIHGVPQHGKYQSIQDCRATRKAQRSAWVRTQRAAVRNPVGPGGMGIDTI